MTLLGKDAGCPRASSPPSASHRYILGTQHLEEMKTHAQFVGLLVFSGAGGWGGGLVSASPSYR